MARKITRKGLIKKLDEVVSDMVIERDKKCVVCGSTDKLGCGHIFSRRALNTRWDTSLDGNCHAQCWPCNFKHSARDTYPYFNWYIKKFGQKKFDELHRRFTTITHLKDYQLTELYEELSK